ncbi:MAG: hypothetical protein CMH57_10035 [Myxococcales bacterium]|nr:hypothetical protein [Myxococcales bacterium]
MALGLAVALSLTAMATDAEAQKRGKRVAADYFKQMIVLSDSSFPASFDNEKEFIAFMKKARLSELYPEKKEGSWSFFYMAFLPRPNKRGKHVVTFYDITKRDKPITVTDSATYPTQSNQRAISGSYTLDRPFFKPDHVYLMTYSQGSTGEVLAEVEFTLKPYDAERAARLKAQREEEARKQREANEKRLKDINNPDLEWEPPNW